MNRSMRSLFAAVLAVMIAVTGTVMLQARSSDGGSAPDLYVALGASDSVGVGANDPATEGWVPRVHAALPAGTRLLNLGISGATMERIATEELPPALDACPQIVTLWAGVNDLLQRVPLATFSTNLDTSLRRLREAAGPDARIVVLNLPNLRHVPVFHGIDPTLLDHTVGAWNAAIADTAERHGAHVVDLYGRWPELADHPEYISTDGFHPSSEGYERIAALVMEVLEADAAHAP